MFGGKNATKDQLVRQGIVLGLIEVAYIVLVALAIFVGETIFPLSAAGAILGTISFLILFVVSAGVTGVLIFGYPLSLMFQKKVEEAKTLVNSILATLIVAFIILLLIAAIF